MYGHKYQMSLSDILREISLMDRRVEGGNTYNPFEVNYEKEQKVEKFNKGGFIIGSVSGEDISFAKTPRVHPDIISAKNEAERLAKANPGKEFIVVSIVGRVKAAAVEWK